MSELETRKPEQLPEAAIAPADAVIVVQAPGGPVQKLRVDRLLKSGRPDTVAETLVDLLADLEFGAGAIALVYADPDATKIGWYIKSGAPGAGSWSIISTLPSADLEYRARLGDPDEGAALVAFRQAGLNAAPRTTILKLRESVSVADFRLPGDPNDTAAFNRALATGKKVKVVAFDGSGPGGDYLVNFVALASGAYIHGEGERTVVRPAIAANGNCFYAKSASAAAFIDGVVLRDLVLRGRSEEAGFLEQEHLMRLSGVRRVTIDNLQVLGPRGDGLYLGSGDAFGEERHNFDVRVMNCLFDGLNFENRNGISVIDGIGINISRNTFRRWSRPNMPGPIDFEPDALAFHRISDVVIEGNRFDANGGNLGQISFLMPPPVPLASRISIRSNKFSNYLGSGADFAVDMRRLLTPADSSQAITFDDNHGVNGNRPIDLYSSKGVSIGSGNHFQDYPNAPLFGWTGATDLTRDVTIDGVFRLVGTSLPSGAGVRVFKVDRAIMSGLYDRCGHASAAGFPIQFGSSANSGNVTLRNLTVVPAAGQTIAINDAGHTFDTPAANRVRNVELGGLLNQFPFRSETRAAIAFANGWVDSGGTLVERNGDGRVSINLNINGGGTALNTLVGALPVGFRPTAQVFGAFQSGTAFAGLRFDPDGSIYITPIAAPADSFKGFISFTTGV